MTVKLLRNFIDISTYRGLYNTFTNWNFYAG